MKRFDNSTAGEVLASCETENSVYFDIGIGANRVGRPTTIFNGLVGV